MAPHPCSCLGCREPEITGIGACVKCDDTFRLHGHCRNCGKFLLEEEVTPAVLCRECPQTEDPLQPLTVRIHERTGARYDASRVIAERLGDRDADKLFAWMERFGLMNKRPGILEHALSFIENPRDAERDGRLSAFRDFGRNTFCHLECGEPDLTTPPICARCVRKRHEGLDWTETPNCPECDSTLIPLKSAGAGAESYDTEYARAHNEATECLLQETVNPEFAWNRVAFDEGRHRINTLRRQIETADDADMKAEKRELLDRALKDHPDLA